MQDRHQVSAWKSWMALAVMLAFVGITLAQAPRQGRGARGQVRNQGGAPLKKARPEAGDPLAKVVAAPARPAWDISLHVAAPLVRRGATSRYVLSVEAWLISPRGNAHS
jgi:hypothetical protein